MKNLQIKGRWHIFNAYVAEVEINFQKVTQVYTVYIFIFVFSVEQTRIWVNGMYGEGKEVCLPKGSIFFFFKDLLLFKAFWVIATAVWKATLAEVIKYGTCKRSLLPLPLFAECE